MRRGFIDDDNGRQIHFRQAGAGQSATPLLALHGCPGSARQLVPLINAMSLSRPVFAPDLPGLGDSDPLASPDSEIGDYAAAILRFADHAGLERFDIYGTHTGASVACELAIHAPQRVGRIIADGLGCFDAETARAFLEHYAPAFEPTLDGSYLQQAFHFCRDQLLFFPWYDKRAEARRKGGMMPAEALDAWVIEVLKAGTTYRHAYHAAFRWDWAGRLPQVPHQILVTAAQDDPLASMTEHATPLLPQGRWASLPSFGDPAFASMRQALFTEFLDGA